jgi:hypothetical protein
MSKAKKHEAEDPAGAQQPAQDGGHERQPGGDQVGMDGREGGALAGKNVRVDMAGDLSAAAAGTAAAGLADDQPDEDEGQAQAADDTVAPGAQAEGQTAQRRFQELLTEKDDADNEWIGSEDMPQRDGIPHSDITDAATHCAMRAWCAIMMIAPIAPERNEVLAELHAYSRKRGFPQPEVLARKCCEIKGEPYPYASITDQTLADQVFWTAFRGVILALEPFRIEDEEPALPAA